MFHNLLNITGSFLASVIRHKIAPFGINPFVMPKNKVIHEILKNIKESFLYLNG